jgi:hypothetical protein
MRRWYGESLFLHITLAKWSPPSTYTDSLRRGDLELTRLRLLERATGVVALAANGDMVQ